MENEPVSAGKKSIEGSGASSARLGGTLREDTVAGLINAVVSVPDGLASAALATVNPVYGLYTSIAAPIAGSLLASAQLMQVSTTSASALMAAQAISGYPAEARSKALFLIVILTGLFLALFGILRFGRLVRFVSHAVMTGFLTGVAVVLILNQLAPLVGYEPEGGNEVVRFFDLLRNFDQVSGLTLLVGALALGISFLLDRTRLTTVSSLIALVIPTALVVLAGWASVQTVEDVSPIPRGLPDLVIPDPSLLSLDLLLSAFTMAVVIAIQGAGVSQSVENPDDSDIDPSRDMFAQGAANVASGLLSGIPAGGSVGQTALNVRVGARSRLAGVLAGLWMLVIVLLAAGLVEQVPMTVLAALMILAGISAIDLKEARSIWNSGDSARWPILITFVATLVLSVPMAVGIGVLVTILIFLMSSASDVTVHALIRLENGDMVEGSIPERLPSNAVTVINIYGSLFFAGARTLGDLLPDPAGVTRPVVVLRLRGHTQVGSTLIDELDEYAGELAEAGGRLYLSGLGKEAADHLTHSGKLDLNQTVHLFPAGDTLGASTGQAVADARAWLGSAAKHEQA